METIIASTNDIRLIVQHVGIDALMDEMIERLTSASVAYDPCETNIPARAGFQYDRPDTGLLEWMLAMQTSSSVTLKMVGYHPKNLSLRNLPTILSTTLTEIPTVLKSTGWALEDQVAAEMLLDFAKQLKLGTMIQIESVSSDPRNPYQFDLEKNYSILVSEFTLSKNLEA